jgi:hypothetical protein
MSSTPRESVLEGRLVVVLGTIRSGTSWLVELLGSHPDVGITKGESWIFNSLVDLFLNAHASWDGPSALQDRAEVVVLMRRFCDDIFSAAMARQAPGASWFVEKTPGHTSRIPIMAATYPDAWYIHLVRDGRDVARSIMQTSWGHDSPGDAASAWVAGLRAVQEQSWRLPRFRELRYEELLVDPVGQVAGLLAWLGLDVDAAVEQQIKNAADTEVSRFSATDPVGTGKWRDLPADALAKIYEEAGDMLLELGYITDPVRPSPTPGSA